MWPREVAGRLSQVPLARHDMHVDLGKAASAGHVEMPWQRQASTSAGHGIGKPCLRYVSTYGKTPFSPATSK